MELRIDFNPRTAGVYTFFEYKEQEYYADLCHLIDGDTECMIFASKDKQVTSWTDLYCKRGIPVTSAALKKCVEEFIRQLDENNLMDS